MLKLLLELRMTMPYDWVGSYEKQRVLLWVLLSNYARYDKDR